MTPLPGALDTKATLSGWNICRDIFAKTWDSGEGAFLFGGRWNSIGTRVVYCGIDPSTSILEVAVHKGFGTLDTVPHKLISFAVSDVTKVHVVRPADVPNPNWLAPGTPSAGQQAFGDALLSAHPFVLIPSAVSSNSWNLLVNATTAAPFITDVNIMTLALDTRLHPPVKKP